jgi:hypothetical protein
MGEGDGEGEPAGEPLGDSEGEALGEASAEEAGMCLAAVLVDPQAASRRMATTWARTFNRRTLWGMPGLRVATSLVAFSPLCQRAFAQAVTFPVRCPD